MAEGGGIGPRSTEGTRAYKARSSGQLVTLRSGLIIGASSRSVPRPAKDIGTGLRVFARPHDEVQRRWGRAMRILSMGTLLLNSLAAFSVDRNLRTALGWVCRNAVLKAYRRDSLARVPFDFHSQIPAQITNYER